MKKRHLEVLRSVLSLPTAPFREEAVVAYVRRWAERRGLEFSRDRGGNVLVRYRRGAGNRPTWVFSAHMDHPGFIARRRRGRRVWAEFRGTVAKGYGLGVRVRLFAPAGPVVATVATRRAVPRTTWWTCRLELAAVADVPAGTVGMWDFPAFRLRGERVSARGCDDQAGTAAVICAVDEIARRGGEADVIGLLTRAEEAGFIGALAACRDGSIPPGALVVAIEASKAQPAAPLGGGVVVRVGDKARTFDPSLTAHVTAVAAALAKRRPAFRFTRQLMPGGTCESTAYAAFGHTVAALALPLANYHNMGPDGRIAPEQIHLTDFASLVALLIALAADPRTPADTDRRLRASFDDLLRRRGRLLHETSGTPPTSR